MLLTTENIYFMPFEDIVPEEAIKYGNYRELQTKFQEHQLYTNLDTITIFRDYRLEAKETGDLKWNERYSLPINCTKETLISTKKKNLITKKQHLLKQKMFQIYGYYNVVLPRKDIVELHIPFNPHEHFEQVFIPEGYTLIKCIDKRDIFEDYTLIYQNDVPVIRDKKEEFGIPLLKDDYIKYPALLKRKD